MGYPHGTDHGLRNRRDEKLQRAVGASCCVIRGAGISVHGTAVIDRR